LAQEKVAKIVQGGEPRLPNKQETRPPAKVASSSFGYFRLLQKPKFVVQLWHAMKSLHRQSAGDQT
jgi:hypothetical protein